MAVVLGVRSLGWPLIHDAPLMHYVAWRIGEGAVPYRDLFDMNFPGTYLLHLGVLRTLGPGDTAWRVFDLAWLAATCLAIAALARRWGMVAASGGGALFALYHLAGGAWQAGQRDYLLAGLLVAGALGVARWGESAGLMNLGWSGLALGAGVTIKPHAVIFAGALALMVVIAAVRSGRGALMPLAALGAGTAVVPAAVVAWVALVGGLPAWRDIVLDYLLPLYGRLGRPRSWAFHRWQVWLPLAAAVVLALTDAVRTRCADIRHAVATLGIGYGLVHYFGQGKGWEYHLYPLAAFAAVLAFSRLPAASARRNVLAPALVASLALAVLLLGEKGVEASHASWIEDKRRAVEALTADLAGLAPGETVQVLDTTGGGIHALFRRRLREPTRFLYDFHFFHDETAPAIRALRGELMRGLAARPPARVVVFEEGWPVARLDRLERFEELAAFLARSYTIVRFGPGYVIHAKRHDP
jgi:hypothetical protein